MLRSIVFCEILIATIYASRTFHTAGSKPNIIFILADDLGWNDVSFHGSNQIPTPNIDALAYNGVILNRHYTPAICTPSRTSLLSGKYPIRSGFQHMVLAEHEPRGFPLTEKLLPQYLKEAGYSTHLVGKWHLGFDRKEYTPTYRGFDTHFGFWGSHQDYYDHSLLAPFDGEDFLGLSMRRNMDVASDSIGNYSTDLFTREAIRLINAHDKVKPMFLFMSHLAVHSANHYDLQAPAEEIQKFSYIKDPRRRIYAAMVSKLDESIGEVISTLQRHNMLSNSIVIFASDNGAPTTGFLFKNSGSNYPLRGIKGNVWEGSARSVAAIWSPHIKYTKRISNQMISVLDWLPTLCSAAGIEPHQWNSVDGINLWPSLTSKKEVRSRDLEYLVTMDSILNMTSFLQGNFKYVKGAMENENGWYGETGRKENNAVEGNSVEYDVSAVLKSKVGRAILKEISRINLNNFPMKKIGLTGDKILQLRSQAEVKCGVEEKDKIKCEPSIAECLFDVENDPCEMVNLADKKINILSSMKAALNKYKEIIKCPGNVPYDPSANPKFWNNTWSTWRDPESLKSLPFDVRATVISLQTPSMPNENGTLEFSSPVCKQISLDIASREEAFFTG